MGDGVPFCKQCGAPQIRVPEVEPERTAHVQPGESSPDILAPPPLPTLPPAFSQTRAGAVQWSLALPGAALGGVFSLLAMVTSQLSMAVPDALIGLTSLLGGALAVLLYRRKSGGIVPAAGAGARIGTASGGFGFLYLAVIQVAKAVYHPAEVHDGMLKLASQMAAQGYPQEKVGQIQQLADSPDGIALFVFALLFVMLLIMVAGSSIGGAFYAAWSRRRPRQ